jgi:hypothetical protein
MCRAVRSCCRPIVGWLVGGPDDPAGAEVCRSALGRARWRACRFRIRLGTVGGLPARWRRWGGHLMSAHMRRNISPQNLAPAVIGCAPRGLYSLLPSKE